MDGISAANNYLMFSDRTLGMYFYFIFTRTKVYIEMYLKSNDKQITFFNDMYIL